MAPFLLPCGSGFAVTADLRSSFGLPSGSFGCWLASRRGLGRSSVWSGPSSAFRSGEAGPYVDRHGRPSLAEQLFAVEDGSRGGSPRMVVGGNGCSVRAGEAMAVLCRLDQSVFGRVVQLPVRTMPGCGRGDDGDVYGRRDPVEGIVVAACLHDRVSGCGDFWMFVVASAWSWHDGFVGGVRASEGVVHGVVVLGGAPGEGLPGKNLSVDGVGVCGCRLTSLEAPSRSSIPAHPRIQFFG